MSFGDYNVRHGSLTPRDSFSAYSKQDNPSMMMYRGSQFPDEMEYPMSPRLVMRTARTPVLSNDDCLGLTEIKDVRLHNNLLEEIFNVEDSIELDYFELERQEANYSNYLSGYSSPSNARLSLELKRDDTGLYRGFGGESNSYHLHEMQNRRLDSKDSVVGGTCINQAKVTRQGTYENGGQELVAVASPTISSTCEGAGLVGSAQSGVGNISCDSPRALAVTDSTSVHSTTNAAGNDKFVSADSKFVTDGNQKCSKELDSVSEKPQLTVMEPVQNCGTRANIRPRVESRSCNGNVPQQMGGINGACMLRAGDPVVPPSTSGGPAAGGDSTATSSSSTSPSQLHVTKRQRVIDCGSDLLAEVREAYDYVQGADLYAPSYHPTFTKLDVDAVSMPFQPNTDKSDQPPMNFNFAGQMGSGPVAFVGNGRVGDRLQTVTQQQAQAGMPYAGSRSTGSPAINYQSCPDLASPGHSQVQARVAYPRYIPQRPPADEASTASLSAPTTPSKRAGPWSIGTQQFRSPSLQAHWQPGVPMARNNTMPAQISCQDVAVNSGHRVSLSAQFQRNPEQTGSGNVCGSYTQQFCSFSRPQSPLLVPANGRATYHNAVQSRSPYVHVQPSSNSFRAVNTQMPGPDGCIASDASGIAEGVPLSENAFLRSVINDESLVFRSHPLFPLLRDIIIADMNFHTPSFPFQLIANLPADFNRLVQNYMQRNPQLGSVTVSDPHTETVVMDALAYAHAALIGKIEARKMKENVVDGQRGSVTADGIEDFCETFERTVKPVVDEYTGIAFPAVSGNGTGSEGDVKYQFTVPQPTTPGGHNTSHFNTRLPQPFHNTSDLSSSLSYRLNSPPPSSTRTQQLQQQRDGRLIPHSHSLPSSPHKIHQQMSSQLCGPNIYHGGSFGDVSYNMMMEKPTTNRSKVLPKEAVALMTDWLRQHRDNPYPNDDEKEALIASTRLTMNQINYWFTNARRRLLPKWTLQQQLAEQDQKLNREDSPRSPLVHQPREDVIVL